MARAAKHARSGKRGTGWLAVAAAAAAAAPLAIGSGVVPSAAAAAPQFPYLPEPARVLTLALLPGGNDDDMQGVVCDGGRSCVAVPYPYLFRDVGVTDLNNALNSPLPNPEQPQQIVFGYSQGARIAGEWIEKYGTTEGALSPENVSFVLIGNPNRKHGGANLGWGQATPDSEYKVLDVARQYDLAVDFPDNPLNLLALANAYAGFSFIHPNYEDVDLYSPDNYVWNEGNTTYVFIPTKNIPLLMPLRWFGLGALADALNEPLKAMIEKAYDRSYLPATPGIPPREPVPEPQPEPETPPTASGSSNPVTELAFARATSSDLDADGADAVPQGSQVSDVDDGGSDLADRDSGDVDGGLIVDDDVDEDDADGSSADVDEDVDIDIEDEDQAQQDEQDASAADKDATDSPADNDPGTDSET